MKQVSSTGVAGQQDFRVEAEQASSFDRSVSLAKVSKTKSDGKIDTDLAKAIGKGDAEAVRSRLSKLPKGAIDGVDSKGRSALHLALGADKGRHEMIRLLVEVGSIDLAALDGEGKSALHNAIEGAKSGKDPALAGIADYLLGRSTGDLGKAVGANDSDRVKELLDAGASAKGVYRRGITYVARAAANKQIDIVKALLEPLSKKERVAVINRADAIGGNTAVHAAKLASDDIYQLLLDNGGNREATNAHGDKPQEMQRKHEKRGNMDYVGSPYPTLGWDTNLMEGMGEMPERPAAPSPSAGGSGHSVRPYQREESEAREVVREISERLGYTVLFDWHINDADQRVIVQIGNIKIEGDARRTLRNQISFITGQLRNLRAASHHYTGLYTIQRLFGAPHFVTLQHNASSNSIRREGQYVTIQLTGEGGVDVSGESSWNTPEQSPADVVTVEYLIRAADMLDELDTSEVIVSNGIEIDENWARAIGLGEFWSRNGALNGYRIERGLDLRTFFNNADEVDADGEWGNGSTETQLVDRLTSIMRRVGITGQAKWVEHNHGFSHDPTISVRIGNFTIVGQYPTSFASRSDQISFISTIIRYLDLFTGWDHGGDILRALQYGPPVQIARTALGADFSDNYNIESGRRVIRVSGIDVFADRSDQRDAMGDSYFAHEMLHAYHDQTGQLLEQRFEIPGIRNILMEEALTVGLGPYQFLDTTERGYNSYRGYTSREVYDYSHELDRNGNWGGIDATNAHDWWTQYDEIRRKEAESRKSDRWPKRSIAEEGYKPVTTEKQYFDLLSGDEGVRTFFSSDDESIAGIRFHQEDADGKVINQGVIDRKKNSEAAGQALYERDVIERIQNDEYDFSSLFFLRFADKTGRPKWSDALTRIVDGWLKNVDVSDDEAETLAGKIASGEGGWTKKAAEAIQGGEVVEDNEILSKAVDAALYDPDASPSEQDYEDALNALAVWFENRMAKNLGRGDMPAFDDEAKGYLEILVARHLHNFPAKGADKKATRLQQIYHFGEDYLASDLPNMIGNRVQKAFRDRGWGGIQKDARDAVRKDLENDKSENGKLLSQEISRQHDAYMNWAENTHTHDDLRI